MTAEPRMTVLQVNKFGWPKGGSEMAYLGTARLLEGHGHSVIPFTMKDDRNPPSVYSRYFVENVDFDCAGVFEKLGAAAKVVYSFEARDKMAALLSDYRPDVAHFHNFHHQISPSVFGPLKERGVPIVMTVHDLKPMCPNYKMLSGGALCERCKGGRYYNCILERCVKGSAIKSAVAAVEMSFHRLMGYYNDVDVFIAPSSFMRAKMVEYGFPPEKVTVVPNFIDSSVYSYAGKDKGYALYCGRLSEEKGVATLLEAAGLCREVRFCIAGTGPMEARLKADAARDGIDNVRFVGHQTGESLRRLYSGCRVTVIPSECYENCPMSALESFASGRPVVGARIGGIPELITEGVDGLTFTPGNAADLADKLRSIFHAGQGPIAEMARSARRKAEAAYAPDRYYRLLVGLYRDALHRRTGNEADN